ncbi:uncharacterized protein V6R79_006690 [Siganus canaliculatus]
MESSECPAERTQQLLRVSAETRTTDDNFLQPAVRGRRAGTPPLRTHASSVSSWTRVQGAFVLRVAASVYVNSLFVGREKEKEKEKEKEQAGRTGLDLISQTRFNMSSLTLQFLYRWFYTVVRLRSTSWTLVVVVRLLGNHQRVWDVCAPPELRSFKS